MIDLGKVAVAVSGCAVIRLVLKEQRDHELASTRYHHGVRGPVAQSPLRSRYGPAPQRTWASPAERKTRMETCAIVEGMDLDGLFRILDRHFDGAFRVVEYAKGIKNGQLTHFVSMEAKAS